MMSNFEALEEDSLPAQLQTIAGDTVYPRAERWKFRNGIKVFSFNFKSVPLCAQGLIPAWKRVLIWYLQSRSAHHADAAFHRVLHLLRFIETVRPGPITEITPADILNYRDALPVSRAWYLGTVAGFLKRWSDLGYAGVPPETARLLKSLRLPGNTKGEAVRTSDPVEGPLTDIEFTALMGALNDGLGSGQVLDDDFLIVWLSACLGLRSVQIALLKIKDLDVSLAAGQPALLNVPRVKQRDAATRALLRSRPVTREIGLLMLRQAAQVRQRFGSQDGELPLFPAGDEAEWLVGFEWHRTSASIAASVKSVAEALDVRSERTGQRLKITPRRLRRSFGTRAAAEGMGEYEVADLLDHSDTQNARVYVEATSEIIERLDKSLAFKLGPLAQAFTGHFIATEELRSSPGGIVRGGGKELPLGGCGQQAFCGFAAPIACYTCRQFRAWRDGPHEAVLDQLIRDRECLQATTDARIAAVNDRTILAVAEVVRLCAEANDDA